MVRDTEKSSTGHTRKAGGEVMKFLLAKETKGRPPSYAIKCTMGRSYLADPHTYTGWTYQLRQTPALDNRKKQPGKLHKLGLIC